MAKYIKGEAVANATAYTLHNKNNNYEHLAEQTENVTEGINFNLDELALPAGVVTLVVKAKADGYEDSDYSNEITYVNGARESLINIDMNNGQNIGTGTGKYNATVFGDGVFGNGKFKTNNGTGYATIPIDFISSKTSKFTAFFIFENWVKGSAKYGRFFRFSSDVPNTYLNDPTVTGGSYSIRFKLLNNYTTSVVDYINPDILKKESASDYYYIPVEAGEKLAIAVRCDGEKYSYWKDGILVATTKCTNDTPSSCNWNELQIGDQPQQYALSSFECSKIMVWNDSLSDEEMETLKR